MVIILNLKPKEVMVYYGNNSKQLGGIGEMCFNSPSNSYQITVYNEDYKTPDWFKTGIAYQIFCRQILQTATKTENF